LRLKPLKPTISLIEELYAFSVEAMGADASHHMA